MKRLCSIMLFVLCLNYFICSSIADKTRRPIGDATIRGIVIDTSPEQRPIESATVTIVSVNLDGKEYQEYIVTTDKDGVYEKTGLPAGRYTISVSKRGYGNRVSKSKIVAPGGELYHPIKMLKKENILSFLLRNLFTWQLIVGFAIGFLVALLISSPRSRV